MIQQKEEKMNSLFDHVQLYQTLGFSVIQIPKGSKGKGLKYSWTKYQTEKADSNQIQQWFGSQEHPKDSNIAVLCGDISGNGSGQLIGIDFDKKGHFEQIFSDGPIFDQTLVVKSGSGKHHLYLLLENDSFPNIKLTRNKKEILSIRVNGQFLVAPPSIHPDTKKKYKIISRTHEIQKVKTKDELYNFLLALFDQDDDDDLITQLNRQYLNLPNTKTQQYDQNSIRIFPNQQAQIDLILSPASKLKICVKNVIEKMIQEQKHFSHEINRIVGTELVINGFTEDQFHIVFSYAHDYDQTITSAQYRSLSQKLTDGSLKYNPKSCDSLQHTEICLGPSCLQHSEHIVEPTIEPLPMTLDERNKILQDQKKNYLKKRLAKTSKEKEFLNLLPTDHWISRYIKNCQEITDAYPEYNFACALELLGFQTQRHLIIDIMPRLLYPNFYILIFGEPGYSRKSVALEQMEKMIANKDVLLEGAFSSESLADNLKDQPNSIFFYDEFGVFWKNCEKKYGETIKENLSSIFYCPAEKKLTNFKNSVVKAKNLFPFFIGGIQPEFFGEIMNASAIRQGFLTRFLVIYAERDKKQMDQPDPEPRIDTEFNHLKDWLVEIETFFNAYYLNIPMKIKRSVESKIRYNDWSRELSQSNHNLDNSIMKSFTSRLTESALKLATIFVLGDPKIRFYFQQFNSSDDDGNIIQTPVLDQDTELWSPNGDLKIPLHYLELAIYYIENLFFPSAEQMINLVNTHLDYHHQRKVHKIILEEQGILRSKLIRKARLKKKDLEDILDTLIESDLILPVSEPNSNQTRSQTKYYAVNPEE